MIINVINPEGVIIRKIPIIVKKNKYENGKIYALFNRTDTYIGSTTQTLENRLIRHESQFRGGKYYCSQEILKEPPYYIIKLEDYPCYSRQELERREGWYQLNNRCINKNIAGRTLKEYYIDNKKELLDKRKKYHEQNREEILDKQKEYYEQNRDKISEQHKKYREQNKDKLAEKAKCDICNEEMRKSCIKRHKRNKH